MSISRGRSTDKKFSRLNSSFNARPRKLSCSELKLKISEYENKVKQLESTRASSNKKKPFRLNQTLGKSYEPLNSYGKTALKLHLSTSMQSDITCIDSSNLDTQELRALNSFKKPSNQSIHPKSLDLSQDINVEINKSSPVLEKSLENVQEIEKTPAFKTYQSSSPEKSKPCERSTTKKLKKLISDPPAIKTDNLLEQFKSFVESVSHKSSSKIDKNSETDLTTCSFIDREEHFNKKLTEITSEHERKVRALEEHLSSLKKDNERLNTLLGDKEASMEVKKLRNLCENTVNNSIDASKAYISLTKAYEELKAENERLISSSKLCRKCKAFAQTDIELSNKIKRIRNYLNNQS